MVKDSNAEPQATSQADTWMELVLNVACPTAVLVSLSSDDRLGPALALVVGLAFPMAHASYSFAKTRSISPLSGLAVFSVVLTGGIGLLHLDAQWFAIKEAVVPLCMGVFTAGSRYTPWPVVDTIGYRLLDRTKVQAAMADRGGLEALHPHFDVVGRWFIASFVYSAVASYFLAQYLVTSQTGTPEFNAELGKFTMVSFPVVALPMTIAVGIPLNNMLNKIEAATGVEIDELLRAGLAPKKAPEAQA